MSAIQQVLLSGHDKTWSDVFGVTLNFNGFDISDTGFVYAGVEAGYLQRGNIATGVLDQVSAAGLHRWLAPSCTADGTFIAVAQSDNKIWTSRNGSSYRLNTSSTAGSWRAISIPKNTSAGGVAVMGANDLNRSIYYPSTTDFSSPTISVFGTSGVDWNCVAISNDGLTGLAGSGWDGFTTGYLWTSVDVNNSWTQRISSGLAVWTGCAMTGDASIMVASSTSGIKLSTDGGANWSLVLAGSYSDVACTSDGSLILAASNGYLQISLDQGVTWKQQTSAGSRDWRCVSISANNTYIAASAWGGSIWILL